LTYLSKIKCSSATQDELKSPKNRKRCKDLKRVLKLARLCKKGVFKMSVPFKVDLKDKVAVITGGGGILCGVMAKALSECGAKVAVLDLREENAARVADEIKAAGGIAIGVAANVLEYDSLKNAEKIICEQLGPCDILVNGAGGNNPKGTTSREYLFKEDLAKAGKELTTFFDLDPVGVGFVFNLNFLGTLLPTQIFCRKMAENNGGVVINISSMNAFTPLTKIPAYSGAKAAISNFTQWLAVHMSKVNIRVNAIAPGFFLTDQNRALLTNADGSLTPRGQTIIAHTPMGQFGTPEDLIGALLWLVDEKGARFVNGTVIPVDGGFSAFSGV
jgi:NAD(P)-dependent dehydrogenase (short-subunit alcohol dehydrogenase family)